MTKEDQIVTLGAIGILAAIGWLVYQNRVGVPLSIAGASVEDQIGARVPFYSRDGHYGAFGTMPTYWENHRLVYPREPCPLLAAHLRGDMNMRRPAFDADNCAWFTDPPPESVINE
jgi:hypothetical protein